MSRGNTPRRLHVPIRLLTTAEQTYNGSDPVRKGAIVPVHSKSRDPECMIPLSIEPA
jgi:hypothetical protein